MIPRQCSNLGLEARPIRPLDPRLIRPPRAVGPHRPRELAEQTPGARQEVEGCAVPAVDLLCAGGESRRVESGLGAPRGLGACASTRLSEGLER